jgi:hypothetical protein
MWKLLCTVGWAHIGCPVNKVFIFTYGHISRLTKQKIPEFRPLRRNQNDSPPATLPGMFQWLNVWPVGSFSLTYTYK